MSASILTASYLRRPLSFLNDCPVVEDPQGWRCFRPFNCATLLTVASCRVAQ